MIIQKYHIVSAPTPVGHSVRDPHRGSQAWSERDIEFGRADQLFMRTGGCHL